MAAKNIAVDGIEIKNKTKEETVAILDKFIEGLKLVLEESSRDDVQIAVDRILIQTSD